MQRHQSSTRVEWPTILVALVIHLAWVLLTLAYARLPIPVLFVLGGCVTAWHGSLQHEVIHGHPTPWRRLNRTLASVPMSVWLPFDVYRRSHIAHHLTVAVTDPDHDPESRYVRRRHGLAAKWRRTVALAQASLVGRVALGPVLEVSQFLFGQAGDIVAGRVGARRAWLWHAVALAALLTWLVLVCRMPLGIYLLCFVYPGAALSMLRAFAEHRADPNPDRRVAIVENAPLLGLLFFSTTTFTRPITAGPELPGFSFPGFMDRTVRACWRQTVGLSTTATARFYAASGDARTITSTMTWPPSAWTRSHELV
jgi:fatty acid desaturase